MAPVSDLFESAVARQAGEAFVPATIATIRG